MKARPPAVPGSKPASGKTTAPGAKQGLSRKQRLTQSSLFREAYAQGRRWIGPNMVLWLREGEGAALRLGVVAGRKVGKAVFRARAKRTLREAFRKNRSRFSGPYDVVLIARRRLLAASGSEVEKELLRLARKAGLVKREDRQPGHEKE